MAPSSDRDLVARTRDGDSEAFGVLVRRHQKRLFRLAFHMLRSGAEAEDVTQETFVRAYQAIDRFDGRSEPFTWLYRICVNVSLNQLRTRKSRGPTIAGDDPRVLALLEDRPGGRDPAAAALDREMAEALASGIDGLSETLRTTLILVCVDGLAHEEAASVLGCPEGTIAWRVHEARRKLREHLRARGFGGERP